MHTRSFFLASFASLFAITLITSAGGCDAKKPAAPAGTGIISPTTAADHRYTVRGRVDALPGPGRHDYFRVHHERIDDFKGKNNDIIGMAEMIMDFPAQTPGALPSGLAVGDPIELDFEVRWTTDPRTLVTKVTVLPADTALNLGKVVEQPPAPTPAPAPAPPQ